ncbi:MAG: threonylcarbamoyl-AMP synthase [Eubacteriales bacterium]|nr:threonylcarbamoyl-AMP synthase [Eubacteriales bacterium]
MITRIRPLDDDALDEAARLIRGGSLVAFPTETVYGLGADALNDEAVKSIFAAKNRAADNPLIVHICRYEQTFIYATERPFYRELALRFWPGPLTMILPAANALIAPSVRCGLATIAFRSPSAAGARALIERSGRPIAAPSANLSGRPSPTTAAHVYEDMNGRVPLILDGGPCAVGIESTVLDLTGEIPVILRPGIVTAEQLRAVTGEVRIHPAALAQLAAGEKAASPGMKYKHYAPRARVTVVSGRRRVETLQSLYDQTANAVLLVSAATAARLRGKIELCGNGDAASAAHELFSALRRCDELGCEQIFAEGYDASDEGLGVMNRLLRAAAFDHIDTDQL